MKVNDTQKMKPFQALNTFYGDQLSDKEIGIWGLAFKPNTDDIREAPSLYLINDLLNIGIKPKVYDPEAMGNIEELYGNKLTYASSYTEAYSGVDALIILTEWSVFRNPDFVHMKQQIKDGLIFDGRNLYDPQEMRQMQFNYISVGRR